MRGERERRERVREGKREKAMKKQVLPYSNVISDMHHHLHSGNEKKIILEISKATDWITNFSR